MSWRFWALLLVLALLAGGSGWLFRRIAPPALTPPPPPGHAPDYYFTDATVTTLDAQGKPQATLRAPRILHHPDDDSVEVFSPRGTYFMAGGPPWQVQSDHALLPKGGKLVNFDGHVVMQRAGAKGGPPLVVHTDKMSINLDTNIATSADPVEILQGRSQMTGVGMQAWLKDNHVILETQVRGEYARQH